MPNAPSAAKIHGSRKEANMNKQKITILYARLSVDDEKQGPSNSIQNQQSMLQDYAKTRGFKPYIHLADDGYSGTNWNRPAWQKVMEEIEAGNVGTLIFKDMTRFGRDYLRMGLLMERFLELNVRMITLNDGIDTANGNDDFTPFRAIMAEWVARDTSRKVKSVLTAKGKSGKPLANIPPYGFVKDPSDKNRWLVDPEAAAVVKRIFEMTIDGMGPYTIARQLCNERIDRPSFYLAQRGLGRYKNTCDDEHRYSWNYSSVVQILKKAEYAGHTVNFKGEKISYKSKKYVAKPESEWAVFKNTHDAIITDETWELVQKLRATIRRHDTLGEANPLTGLVFCADCHAKMHNYRRSKHSLVHRGNKSYRPTPQNSYRCSTFTQSNSKFNAKCSRPVKA